MPQSSSSTSANSDQDVFINHRGPDTKKNFASYLYRCLRTHQLRVFLDQPELRRGDDFSVQIKNAIRSASVHVAIFSPGYADSRWCLDELVQMLDTKKPIIPVFYRVKPADLRRTQGKKGTYAEALETLEKKTDIIPGTRKRKLRYEPGTIEKWRNALSEVADISGFELTECNGDEGELLEKVVVEVLKRVKKLALDRHVPEDAPGLDEKVRNFESFLLQRQQSENPRIFGIVGLGGIGKTTLATKFFNKKKSDYSGSCFLSNVKDAVGNHLILLQKKLLRMLKVTDTKIEEVTDVAEGTAMIRKHLSSYKALVVIDDVDNKDQVDKLLPRQSVIHPDSLILITSRNRDVLSNVEGASIYPLTGLGEKDSLKLFCSHSFDQPYPPQEFEFLVNKFVEACGGLPLSLKVFGAHLRGKNKAVWEEQLNKPLPSGIRQILQISYNALEEWEKEIFLDIATFFIGEDRDRVTRIVGESGLQNIVDRSLVEVDREKRINMHDHVRNMGRELAEDSGLPRRLRRWTKKENDDLSRKSWNGQITDVRGVRIVYEDEDGEDEEDEVGLVDEGILMSSLQFLDAEGDLMERILTKVSSPNLKWLRWTSQPLSTQLPYSLPPSIPMKNLRVLQIEGDELKRLWEEELEPPLQLRELEIKAPLSDIPKSIRQLNHLERIVISYDRIEYVPITELPEEFCFLRSLKELVLEGWKTMKALPNCFGNLTELQHIQLNDCTALDSLPESFGKLTKLQHLQLSRCYGLKSLPESFGKLTKLQHLQLSRSYVLKSLPESFGELTNLQHVDLSDCWTLERLPDSFCKLIKLQHLDLDSCYTLTLQRETLGNISTLKYIDLSGCRKIEVLPSQVARQRSLEQLRLNGTNLKELPSAIGELSCMEVLHLGRWPLLDVLPSSLCHLKNLKELFIWDCEKLKRLPPLLGDLSNLNKLKIVGCDDLNALPTSIGRLTQLTELSVQRCPLIRELPLKEEIVSGKRGTLDDSQILPRLQKLEVSKTEISEVSFAERVCCNLRHLSIESCNNLVKVGKLPNTLIHLSFSKCHNLSRIDQIHGSAKLQYLNISQCIELEELPSIETLISLRSLDATGCVKLKSIRVLGQLTELNSLEVASCSELEELEGIQHCIRLGKLNAKKCMKLKKIRGLEQLKVLEQLCIEGCSDLEEVEGIERCSNLEEVGHLGDCTSSLEIDARGCPKLQLDAGVEEQLRERCGRYVSDTRGSLLAQHFHRGSLLAQHLHDYWSWMQ